MKLGIIGAGGHGRAVSEVANSAGYNDILFFDDKFNDNPSSFYGKYIGNIDKIYDFKDISFIVALGDGALRKKYIKKLEESNFNIISLIHPSAIISKKSKIGIGCVIMHNSVINIASSVDKGSIINTSATIDHDCKIGEFSHICPGVNLAGNVTVGKNSFIGIGSKVIQNINIGSNVTIGAGSTVINDLESNYTFYNLKKNFYEKK